VLFRFFVDYCQPGKTIYDDEGSGKTYPKRSDFEKFVQENAAFKAYAASLI